MRYRSRWGICIALMVIPTPSAGQSGPVPTPPALERHVSGQLGASINNAGLQQSLDVSLVRPLVSSTSPLLKDAHVSSGLAGALTPAQGRVGGWFEIAPLSILEFRVGLDYYRYFGTFNSLQSFENYTDPFDNDAREERGGARSGTAQRLYFAPTIKLQFGPIVIASTTTLEGWRSSAAGTYFYEPTRDTLLKSSGDSLLTLSSVIMYRRPLASGALSLGAIHQEVEAPTPENNVEKYGVIGIREFVGRRFGLPNARLTGVVARYAADPHKKGEWTAALAVGFSLR